MGGRARFIDGGQPPHFQRPPILWRGQPWARRQAQAGLEPSRSRADIITKGYSPRP